MSRGQRVWFYYAKEHQVGPMSEEELSSAIKAGTITGDDFVYREGFPDWKFLKEVKELEKILTESRVKPRLPPQIKSLGDAGKRTRGIRAPIAELVVAHNDAHIATGKINNISISGVFFETKDQVFAVDEEVKLTLKEGRGLGKPLHLRGVVVRHVKNAGEMGYGLELKGLDEQVLGRISEYVQRNKAS